MNDTNLENLQYIIHNIQTNYQQIHNLKNIYFYELFGKTNKINNIHNHRFHYEHLQYKTIVYMNIKYLKHQSFKVIQYP
jgi:hypothetical protein